MKKIMFIIVLMLGAINFTNAQNWLTDLTEAQQVAKEKNQKIILVFSGSDWCLSCIKLEKEIWVSEEFKTYANENYVMLRADFPKKKANKLPKEQQDKNNLLAEKYNLQGYFPFVVVLDKDLKILGTTGYKGIKPKEYIDLLNSF